MYRIYSKGYNNFSHARHKRESTATFEKISCHALYWKDIYLYSLSSRLAPKCLQSPLVFNVPIYIFKRQCFKRPFCVRSPITSVSIIVCHNQNIIGSLHVHQIKGQPPNICFKSNKKQELPFGSYKEIYYAPICMIEISFI